MLQYVAHHKGLIAPGKYLRTGLDICQLLFGFVCGRIVYPPVPVYGSSDLYPSPGAGIFDPRFELGYDGMLLGVYIIL